MEMKKADLRFAKIDADLLTKKPLLCRVPGGIRTPDLPLRSGQVISKTQKGRAFPHHAAGESLNQSLNIFRLVRQTGICQSVYIFSSLHFLIAKS